MNRQGFHMSVTPVTKGKGHSVIAKSAYNSGSKLKDKKTGKTHDYTSKSTEKTVTLVDENNNKTAKKIEKNVAHSVLISPKNAKGVEVKRGQFWNDIELIEKSARAQLGTEIGVMFPAELEHEQRIELVEKYSQNLADRYNVLVDVSIHNPHTHLIKKDNGEILEHTKNNYHAHILMSSREILPNDDNSYSLSKRKNWSLWATSERLKKGLNGRGDELKYQRKLWADLANEMLPENRHITEKSYREQGVNLLPKMKLGKSLYKDILKGKRSVIDEYNETIDELNDYIQANDIEINYNDAGRIDEDVNIQNFKGVKVAYKKRKPFAKLDLNKITLNPPTKELDNTQDADSILANFMQSTDSITTKRKAERSSLLSSVNSLNERLSKQAEREITLTKNLKKFPDIADKLGENWNEDIKQIDKNIKLLQTQDELKAVKDMVKILEEFRADETKQTGANIEQLKNHLQTIEDRAENNSKILKETTPINNRLTARIKHLNELSKPFNKHLTKLDKQLEKVNKLVIDKESWEQDWHNAYNKLIEIDIPVNPSTYAKYIELADYDVDELKRLEREHEQLKQLKASDINEDTQKRLKDLTQSVSEYSDQNTEELTQLKKQVRTSIKTYERLEPLYNEYHEMLDTSLPVIEQDEQLHEEITTAKTTQLSANKLKDWQDRTQALYAQLVREHEQAERDKQAQAEREKQARLERIEQQQQTEKAEYEQRIKDFIGKVLDEVAEHNYKEVNAPDSVISNAEKVAISAFLVDGVENIENLKESQKPLNDEQVSTLQTRSDSDVKEFKTELDKLPNNKRKIKVIEQLNDKFNKVLELQPENKVILTLQTDLEQRQQTAEQEISRANSYSPRPF